MTTTDHLLKNNPLTLVVGHMWTSAIAIEKLKSQYE
tara:strand:+ start:253 stop:360 length:108 start_codon:yes stop_codon:yes gene_type:complete